ncbi:MAG: shikimate kinase AroK [Cellvibrionaceae bacterium]
MLSPQKIVLVGPMGAGKSTIGRLLSKQLQLPFKDSDTVIEERSGANIPWIFDVEGEEGFRQRETAVLQDLLKEPSLVLATGGGIVLMDENRRLLKELADVVIYLSADAEHLIRRTEKDKKRPLLQVADPQQQIRKLLDERDPLYREVATRIVTTDTRSPKIVAKEVAMNLI